MSDTLIDERGWVLAMMRMPIMFCRLLCVCALGFGIAGAAPTDSGRAMRAARGWLLKSDRPMNAQMPTSITRVVSFVDATSNTLFHVVSLESRKSAEASGYVVVAGDDLVEPVICFSSNDNFAASDKNPLYTLLKNDMAIRLGEARKHSALSKAAIPSGEAAAARARWDEYESLAASQAAGPATAGVSGISDVRVSPLLSSAWSQTVVVDSSGNPVTNSSGAEIACYNYYTPSGGDSSGVDYDDGSAANYYCGCVAVAMAQVLRYFKHPTVGVGSASNTIYVQYSTRRGPGGGSAYVSEKASLRGGDGDGGAYSWSSMPLVPASSATASQRQAIGALCFDAGIAVGMEYGSGGSGAWVFDVPTGFKNYFKYSNAIVACPLYRATTGFSTSTPSNYLTMVDSNLDAGRPVIFGIYSSDLYWGHCVVCDGYGYSSGTMYHHINIGWGGYSNLWYNLPTIAADDYTFSVISDCVYNIYKAGTGEIVSGRIVNADGSVMSGVTVKATSSSGTVYSATTNSKGIYALANLPSGITYTISATYTGRVFTSQTVAVGTSTSNPWASGFSGTPTNNSTAVTGNKWGVNFTAALPVPVLSVTPSSGSTLSGSKFGNFTPSSVTYTVTNTGTGALTWTVSANKSWIVLSKTGGSSLAVGATDKVAVTINYASTSLASTQQTGTITFVNTGNTANTAARTITVNLAAAADPAWTVYD
ncbi:MAG: C10 family peptidase [Candidatus Sumerlaeia bacterium]